jgi:hypothetical protein
VLDGFLGVTHYGARRTEEPPFFVAVREKEKSRSAGAAFCKMVVPARIELATKL